ncbi:hypothetical protein EV715DRAFT_192812 [Schizophyllum commune]
MVLKNGRKHMEASEMAAEAHGFARNWGGRLVRHWVRTWIDKRELPVSERGCHAKTFSLLSDPNVRENVRSFLRSNKWSSDPQMLSTFMKNEMLPDLAKRYAVDEIAPQMARGLKQYLEVELFPRIQFKVARGISVRTCNRIMTMEGFTFTEHMKALYFDGHERPDVVDYRQKEFIPAMDAIRPKLIEYVVGEVRKELEKDPTKDSRYNCVEPRLVLCAHDEMTAQANDGRKRSWVLDGEHAIKKKGVGRGMHQSDVICSTVGWLKDASESLEYGKNYEGYWDGERFCRQVRRAPYATHHILGIDITCSCERRSSLSSSACTAQGTEPCFSSTIPRGTRHTRWMPFWRRV